MRTKLYKRDATGALRFWSCEIDYEMECLVITHGVVGGAEQFDNEWISEGKAGRDICEQLELRFNARVHGKKKGGHTEEIPPEGSVPVNLLGLSKPMLAKAMDSLRVKSWPVYVQPKYNGHRCLITKHKGEMIAYSRNGKLIQTIPGVLDLLEPHLVEGETIDGELYVHGMKLQAISSLVKKIQPANDQLLFIAYDVIAQAEYAIRYERLCRISEAVGHNGQFRVAHTVLSSDEAGINEMFRVHLQAGFEGAMVRHGTTPYECSKRSFSLMKLKELFDDEYEVVEITSSKDGWAILTMKAENGKLFSASAPGTIEEKTEVLRERSKYIGKSVTVEFRERTMDGLPFHGVAVQWREKNEE